MGNSITEGWINTDPDFFAGKSYVIRGISGQTTPQMLVRFRPEMIKNYAEKNNIVYLDYFSSMVDERNGLKKELSGDGVHPNLAGYKIMEPLAEAAIKMALKKK
jgi:lysophospholipase L1-like esterase